MTEQLWTIVDTISGEVLAAVFVTSPAGQHPKDAGWPWDAARQRAVKLASRPDPARQDFDIAAGAWVDDLAKLRSWRWAAVKTARDRAEWGGCATLLGRVDTDPDSQRKVSGSVTMAMIAQAAGQPFDLTWTMQDNRSVQHDAAAMIAMGVAVGRHVAACHAEALVRRAAIDAAGDAVAIEAVDISGEWPA